MPAVDVITVAAECQCAAELSAGRLPLWVTHERTIQVIAGRITGAAAFGLIKLPPGDQLTACFFGGCGCFTFEGNNVWFAFKLKWSGRFNGCDKWTFYILGLSPRERTGAASAILEAKGTVIRAVFVFDVEFRGWWLGSVTGQFDTLAKSPL